MALPKSLPIPAIAQTLYYTYRPLQMFDDCAARFGDLFTLRLVVFGDFVMVSSPEHIKQIFTGDSEELLAGKANTVLAPLIGKRSVLLLDGKEHLRQRRLLLPPLHGERMHAYAELLAELTSTAIDRMPQGSRFALHEIMQTITLQVILRAVFGLKKGAQMDALAAAIIAFMKPAPPIVAFVPSQYHHFFEGRWSPLNSFFQTRAEVDRRLRQIIREQQAAPDPDRNDILSLLLKARDEEGRPLTEDELRDELMTMLVAGHETTATALAWTFALLLSHPEVETRLRKELASLPRPSYSALAAALVQSPYLDAVIKEALRLRPIVPDVVRYVEKPMQLGGYEIPVGAYVSPCMHLTHRRADLWPSPLSFRPERFLDAKIDPYTWFPFGGGIRRCLGMAFALYEMKIVLGLTILRTHLRFDEKTLPAPTRRGVTVGPAGGTKVVMESREAL